MAKNRLADTAEIALMSAVIAVCALMTVPAAVPFTLQTFGVFLALVILGGAKGLASVAVYILIGAAGAPVFSGFRGGISVIAGPTGGYIIGFIPLCLIYLIGEKAGKGLVSQIISLSAGLIACYALGTLRFAAVSETQGALHILSLCVFPFVIPDAVKLALALILGRRTKKLLAALRAMGVSGGENDDYAKEELRNENSRDEE